MKLKNYISILAIGLLLSACAQQKGFEAIDIPTTGLEQPGTEVEVDLSKVEAQAMKVDVSVQAAQTEIKSLEGLDFSGIGDAFKLGKIKESILKGFDKIAEKLDGVREKIQQAKMSIQQKIDQLDPNNPLHQKAILELNKMLAKIEQLENKLAQAITRLSDRVDYFFDKIDRLIDKLDFGGFIGDIAQFFLRGMLDDLRFEIQTKFQELVDRVNGNV